MLNITDGQAEYAGEVVETLQNKGFRAENDLRNEKIGFKIREHTLLKTPYLLIVGDREKASRSVAIRTREGEDLGAMPLDQFVEWLGDRVRRRGRAISGN